MACRSRFQIATAKVIDVAVLICNRYIKGTKGRCCRTSPRPLWLEKVSPDGKEDES